MKRTTLILCYIFFAYFCNAQNFDTSNHGFRQTKVGIYKTYEEFLKDNPSIIKPFELIKDTTVDYENHDTIIGSLSYRFIDTLKKINKYWGLFDGEKVYVKFKRQGLIPVSYIGSNSFVVFEEKNHIESPGLFEIFSGLLVDALIVSTIDAAVSPKNLKMYYINNSGHTILANAQSIYWLLKKDKELVNLFNKEKKSNYGVYRKYLILLNEKYPMR